MTPRPKALAPILENIPAELKERRQWVKWRYEYRPDRNTKKPWTKPPFQADGSHAKSDDPSTWNTFEAVIQRTGQFDGIGFMFSSDDPYIGVDLDKCRDPITGDIEPWAREVIDRLDSFTEASVSGTGVHVLVKGQLPAGGRRKGAFEIYKDGRYFTTSGHHLEGTPREIQGRQSEIDTLHREIFGEKARQKPTVNNGPSPDVSVWEDDYILQRMFEASNGEDVRRLWEGDTSGKGGDASAADLALCNHLSWWTQCDAYRVDQLFRRSGLMRPKWDEVHYSNGQTYGQHTIDTAIAQSGSYSGPSTNGHHPPESIPSAPSPRKWPEPMAEEAFYGLAGDVVRAIEPHTEASREALLINFLVAFGNAVGSGPHARAEADRHGCNLFAVLVGQTSKGRKGSSWGHIREMLQRADPEWADNRVLGGLSSGEGLVWAVRDPIQKTEVVREKGKPTRESITYEADPGVTDKRLLVMESEFASVLQVMQRETNTLSAIIRQAWDSGTLRTMTKNTPAQATGAHISILGHVTQEELTRHIGETEAANGFGNRFLWVCTRRARTLPEGGGNPDLNQLVEHLHNALELARHIGRVERDDQTRAVWAEVYPDLSEGQPGLFGAITNRAEAQVLRLSVLYAALDGSRVIQLPHLKAALAVWDYCQASARCIFGDATGDPVADRILEALANGEMDRTGISHLFGRHEPAARITQALSMLQSAGRVRMERQESEGGRPREVWLVA